MSLTLLISLKTDFSSDWSLSHEIQGAVQRGDLKPLQNDGVIPIGRDAILFDQNIAYKSYVLTSAFLIGHDWPFVVLPMEASSILVEGKCGEKLATILGKSPARGLDLT